MRNPVRTEAEAFTFVAIVGLVALAIGLGAWLGGAWVGLGVFLGLLVGIVATIVLGSDPKVKEPAIWERGPRADRKRHLLVIANETCAGAGLLDEIRYRAGSGESEVLVVAPALTGAVRFWASDVDGARADAQARLDASLAALAEAGIRARGEVGDEDPVQAIEDALRTFGADEIIISTHPAGRSNWLERDVVGRARESYDVPISHVVVDLERERAAERSG